MAEEGWDTEWAEHAGEDGEGPEGEAAEEGGPLAPEAPEHRASGEGDGEHSSPASEDVGRGTPSDREPGAADGWGWGEEDPEEEGEAEGKAGEGEEEGPEGEAAASSGGAGAEERRVGEGGNAEGGGEEQPAGEVEAGGERARGAAPEEEAAEEPPLSGAPQPTPAAEGENENWRRWEEEEDEGEQERAARVGDEGEQQKSGEEDAEQREAEERQREEQAAAERAAEAKERQGREREDAAGRAAELRRLQQAEEEAARRVAEEKRRQEEADAAERAAEEKERKEAEAARQVVEEQRRRAEEAETKRLAEEKQRAEEEAAKRAALEKQRQEEQEAAERAAQEKRRLEEEDAARREAEEDRRRKEAAAAAERRAAEAKRQWEEDQEEEEEEEAVDEGKHQLPPESPPAAAESPSVQRGVTFQAVGPDLEAEAAAAAATAAAAAAGWESDPVDTPDKQPQGRSSGAGKEEQRKGSAAGVEALASSAQSYLKSVFQTTLDRVAQATALEPSPAPKEAKPAPAGPQATPAGSRPPEDVPRRTQTRGLGGERLPQAGQPRPTPSSPVTPESSDGTTLRRSPDTTSKEPDKLIAGFRKMDGQAGLAPKEGPHRRTNDNGDHATDKEPLLEHRAAEGVRLRGSASSSGAAADARAETPLNRALHRLFVAARVQDRPACIRLHTFAATTWHASLAPAAEYANANRTRVLLLLLLLWLAWGCAATPEGRRLVGVSTVGVCTSIAVLNLLKEKMEIFMDPSRGEAEGTPTSFTPSHNVVARTVPAVAPALFLSFWAPVPARTGLHATPLAFAHALGSVAVLLLYAVPSYVLAHDEVNDLPVGCLWEWSGRSGFLSVALVVFASVTWNGALGLLESCLLLTLFAGWTLCQQRPDGVKRWAQQTAATLTAGGRIDWQLLPALLWAGLQDGARAAVDILRHTAHAASQGCLGLGGVRHAARGSPGHSRRSDTEFPEVDLEVEGVSRGSSVTVELCDKPRRPSSCTGLLMAPVELALYWTISSPNSRYPGLGLFFAGLWTLTMTWLLSYSSLLACQELHMPISIFGLTITAVYLNLPEFRHRERNARSGRAEESITAAINCCVLLLLFALPGGVVVRAVLLGRWGIATSPGLLTCATALLLAAVAALLAALPHLCPKRLPRRAAQGLRLAYPPLVALAVLWLGTA